ncbi:MAG: VPLPA-CTERM sorting domain-containing protein [Silicimonas sp.]|nr:VPLPA-CTERM sorting domain-containing protein [Silicimonas sp.]
MKSVIVTAALFAAATPALSATVLEYTSASSQNNPALAPSDVGAGVSGYSMFAGAGVMVRPGTTWVWNNWLYGSTPNTNVNEALGSGHSWTWGFDSTQAYDLTDFDIRLDRSGTGPNAFSIGFTTGSTFTTVLSDNFGTGTVGKEYNVDMSAFTGVTGGTFLLAAWGGTSNSGTFDLENLDPEGYGFQLRGTVSSGSGSSGNPNVVPLPAALPMLLAGLGGLGLMRRRRTG